MHANNTSIRPKKKRYHHSQSIPLPSDRSIANISLILSQQFRKHERAKRYAPVKEVLALIGKGAVLSAALLAPKSAKLLLALIRKSPDYDSWKKYHISYLQRTLKRLEKEKQVKKVFENGQPIIQLTNDGKRKVLKLGLESLFSETPKVWDEKWRLVIYDIPRSEKKLSDLIRQLLRTIGFYPVQGSVFLFPYPCFEQIEFVRQYYGLGSKVQYLTVENIENDSAYRSFFGLS